MPQGRPVFRGARGCNCPLRDFRIVALPGWARWRDRAYASLPGKAGRDLSGVLSALWVFVLAHVFVPNQRPFSGDMLQPMRGASRKERGGFSTRHQADSRTARLAARRLSRSWRCGRQPRCREPSRRAIPAFQPWKAPLQLRRVVIRLRFAAGRGRIANF